MRFQLICERMRSFFSAHILVILVVEIFFQFTLLNFSLQIYFRNELIRPDPARPDGDARLTRFLEAFFSALIYYIA